LFVGAAAAAAAAHSPDLIISLFDTKMYSAPDKVATGSGRDRRPHSFLYIILKSITLAE
jgi:hypothetical protein